MADKKRRDEILEQGAEEMRIEYFRLLKKAIKTGLFDVIGHIDIFKKTLPETRFENLRPEWKEVADLMVKHKTGFEINTGRGRITFPSEELITLLKKTGVETVTIGSDAHRTEQVGIGIEDAEEMLLKRGINRIYIFNKRKPIPINLNKCKPELMI